MPVAEHLIAHTRKGDRSLANPDRAPWIWNRLQRHLPDALASTLMPEHLHGLAPPGSQPAFRRGLAAITAKFGVRFDVLDPVPANSPAIARRMIRYIFFNAVRAGLVPDPWSWPWSTLRDLAGAVHPAWTPLPRLARILRVSPSDLIAVLTTTADHRPSPPVGTAPLVASTIAVRQAVSAALRLPHESTQRGRPRRLVIRAHERITPVRPAELARRLDCSVRTVQRHLGRPDPALDAVMLCLSDPRLRVHGCG